MNGLDGLQRSIPQTTAKHAFHGLKRTQNIAHRGGAALWPENTLYAFAGSISAYDCSIIETDVHLLSDGEVVVFHDDTLDRTTDGQGPICQFSWNEVRRLDAGYRFRFGDAGSFPFRGQGMGVPRLVDVLRSFPDTRFNIELKGTDPRLAFAINDILREEQAVERVCIGSEYDGIAEILLELLPEGTHFFPRAALLTWVMSVMTGQVPDSFPYRVIDMPPRYQGIELITPDLVAWASRQGLWLNVWTINNTHEMAELMMLGVNGIMTDRPDRLQRISQSSGHNLINLEA